MTVWILTALLLFPIVYCVVVYNKLVDYSVESANSWSQIDIQLKRRHDLIPRIVQTVKAAMEYEEGTLLELTEARANAVAEPDLLRRLAAEGKITALLERLSGVWEDYPSLKTDRNTWRLQRQLETTEDRIAYTRGYYNDIVANYNTLVEQFPSSLIARVAGFRKRRFFRERSTSGSGSLELETRR